MGTIDPVVSGHVDRPRDFDPTFAAWRRWLFRPGRSIRFMGVESALVFAVACLFRLDAVTMLVNLSILYEREG